ncbi:hypothetical protein EVA_09531 [gut metagenome]|uniref:Uncharacterized protein n=1 Tax=gut metagenome TaxID=749906 RepID=J9GJW8_9ZZZZ
MSRRRATFVLLIFSFIAYIPFIDSWMRFLPRSTLNTRTFTCWCMETTCVGSLTNLSANSDICTSPFSFMPTSTKQPKLVMLVTIPGNTCPSFRSSMLFTSGSNENTCAVSLGSLPGLSSSSIMSCSVGMPTLSVW